MEACSVLLAALVLSSWCPRTRPFDERPDVGHDEDVRPNPLSETDAETLDFPGENWNGPNQDNYEDADWHPPSHPQESHSDLRPDAPLVTRRGGTAPTDATNQTAPAVPAARCGEFSSQLTAGGQCRLIATLPPVGKTQTRCPDMFRCTDDVSFWLHENRNRKQQLGELRETMSELKEELRSHRHRVKALETQVDGSTGQRDKSSLFGGRG